MAVEVCLRRDQGFVEVVYTKMVIPDELAQALDTAAGFAQITGIAKVLTDCKKLEGGHDVINLYNELINEYEKIGVPETFKEAVILPENKKIAEVVKFYEVACKNRGFNVKTFELRGEALQWLLA